MATNKFDQLTKDLARATNRGSFIKSLGLGLAAAAFLSRASVSVASGGSCKTNTDCTPGPCEMPGSCVCQHTTGSGFGTGTCVCQPIVCAKSNQTCCPSTGTCVSGRCH
jgi:hypothetical protein